MLGHMSINVINPTVAVTNPVQAEFVKHSIEVYKDFIRPFLPECKVFHHTPENNACEKTGICVLEISSPDKTRGAAAVFALARPQKSTYTLRVKGADAGKQYKVTLDNSREQFIVDGKVLRSEGIIIEIPSPMTSELVLYEKI